MNPEQLKSHVAKLSDEDQHAFARWTLSELKKRERLEQAASGTVWKKLGPIVPVIGAVVILSFRESLADYFPFIIVFLLVFIQSVNTSLHSRIDAMFELMKLESRKETSAPQDDRGHSSPSSTF
jgi:hypothetical protein